MKRWKCQRHLNKMLTVVALSWPAKHAVLCPISLSSRLLTLRQRTCSLLQCNEMEGKDRFPRCNTLGSSMILNGSIIVTFVNRWTYAPPVPMNIHLHFIQFCYQWPSHPSLPSLAPSVQYSSIMIVCHSHFYHTNFMEFSSCQSSHRRRHLRYSLSSSSITNIVIYANH